MSANPELTPARIVELLDRHIVGQVKAKRAVALALRNRWRRQRLVPEEAAEIYPKNILLVGPTGVGKTEIARRLAALAAAPFLKVEATRFSEVGYHGRDVESMVRDLVETAIDMVRREEGARVGSEAAAAAKERLLQALAAAEQGLEPGAPAPPSPSLFTPAAGELGAFFPEEEEELPETDPALLADLERRLDAGELEGREIEMALLDTSRPTLDIQSGQGNESMAIDTTALQELWGRSVGPRYKQRRLTVREARLALVEEEKGKLLDQEGVLQEALRRTQEDGIIFLDEIDKIVGAGSTEGPDVSREGVQRDLLPLVEGTTVFTKYGFVKTDHILFIGAGAFSAVRPSDLIPELQGRFPVRVALTPLTEEDFRRILTEPRNALTRQYRLLLGTERVELRFTDEGVAALARVAVKANNATQDIGARRLLTVMEKLLEQVSFAAPDRPGEKVVVDADFVREQVGELADDEDLIRYNI